MYSNAIFLRCIPVVLRQNEKVKNKLKNVFWKIPHSFHTQSFNVVNITLKAICDTKEAQAFTDTVISQVHH